MQKPNLPLIIFCFVALSFAGKAQTMYSHVESNAKLKKGDWFNIEFANRLEDYSTPVDSINYCDPIDLKQLVLHCEVTEVTDDNIKMDFKFERIFHLKENGQYGDSYFDINGMLQYQKITNFNFLVDIDLKSNKTEITKPQDRSYLRYTTLYRNVNIDDKSSSTSYPGNRIEYQDIEALIAKFLEDWKATDFKLPLPTFGKVVVDDFERYRILDANIAVIQNTTLLISTNELNAEEEIKVIFIKDKSNEPFQRDDILLLTGEAQNGRIEFQYYLEEQKQLTLVYREKEIDFVATPGKKLEINLLNENDQIILEFSGDNIGDNEYKFQFLLTTTRDRVLNNNMSKIESLDELFNIFNDEINQRLNELNRHKKNMSATWYKKQLKEIYYWAAGYMCYWHQIKNQIMDFSKLKDFVAFSNIHPLYDYYLNLKYYESYLNRFEQYRFGNIFSLIETNQWFSRMYSMDEKYDMINAMFWGYPKFYLLKEILVDGFEFNGLGYTKDKYDTFIENCKYPPLTKEVEKAYEKYEKLEPGKSVLNLDLNFVENENFKLDNGKYKLVYYLVGKFDQQRIDEFKKAIEKAENELDLKNKIEMNILYAEDFLDSAQLETIKNNKEPLVKFVKCSWEELQKDRNSIMTYFYLNFILLSPENTIIHRNASIQSFLHFIQQYIESQNQPTSQAGNSRLLLIIVVSLILSGMLSWFVIRIRTVQIQKRETARRKVSELELTAIRSQMNPHFIFNAMGSIQNLINQNKVKNANLYLASFARLMRMVLANSNKKLVSMAHELEMIETYLQLEQLRVDFKYKISVAENIDPEVEELPGMLIQPFVENAVIHGITPRGTGNIEVAFSKKENTLVCEITDDGVGIDTDKPGNGNGLAMKLSEKRLDLLNSQLHDKLKLVVENRMKTEQTSGTKITLYIPV